MKLTGWSRKEHEQKFIFEYFDDRHALPVYSLIVDSGLGFSITVLGWFLPDDHEIYLEHKRSLFHVTISVKTARNCLFNSGLGKHTRLTWNGKELIWSHIAQLYHSDVEQASNTPASQINPWPHQSYFLFENESDSGSASFKQNCGFGTSSALSRWLSRWNNEVLGDGE